MVYIAEKFVKKPAVHVLLITVYCKQQCNAHSTQIPIKQTSAVLHFSRAYAGYAYKAASQFTYVNFFLNS